MHEPRESSDRRDAALLWALTVLFLARVLGQALVAFAGVTWLPSMDAWYSGLLPYPVLLPLQIVILLVQGTLNVGATRGPGRPKTPRPALARVLRRISYVYALAMLLRYLVTGTHIIPVAFHLVLASYLFVLARSMSGAGDTRPRADARRSVLTAALCVWATAGGCAVASEVLARKLDVREADVGVRIERGVAMMTSDGVRLVADVYRPDRREPVPAILVRLPYPKTPVTRLFATTVGRMWAARGYAVVIQGTRGRYESGGHHYPFRDERRDGVETLQWIAQQPWFDGRLGMWGGSYFGYTQWVLADQAGPGPSALLIQLCSTDLHRMFYPGGAFSLESALYWALRSRGDADDPPDSDTMERGVRGFPLREADDRAVGDVPFFNDWVDHTERDAYWIEIDGDRRPERLRAPVLLMAGWLDPFLPGQLDDFARIRRGADSDDVAKASRLIVGPWAHAETVRPPSGTTPRNYRLESLAPSIAWFDRHLLNGTTPSSPTAPVRLFVMEENVWRDEQEWPLARTRYTAFYLRGGGAANSARGDGTLTLDEPASPEPPDRYVYDPRDPVPTAGGAMIGPRAGIARQNAVEARPDVLVYTTAPLDRDLEVTGPIRLVLHVTTTAPCTDFTGKLVDVHPDGRAYNVSDGILRRHYDTARPGPVEIEVELWPTSWLFRKGHRIRLDVASSNYPRFDRNPNTGRPIATETEPAVALQTIHHDPVTASRLILPLIPRP